MNQLIIDVTDENLVTGVREISLRSHAMNF